MFARDLFKVIVKAEVTENCLTFNTKGSCFIQS